MTFVLVLLLVTATTEPLTFRSDAVYRGWLACEQVRTRVLKAIRGEEIHVTCVSAWPCDPGGLNEPEDC